MSAADIDDTAPKPCSESNGALLQGKRRRGMLGFYVAALALVALAGLGAWLWTAWTNWQFDEPEARRRQAEAARQLGVPVETAVDLGDGVGIELVLIPAGMFDMGSPEGEAGRSSEESPLHRVRISHAFYMGECEVTHEVWKKVMGKDPSWFMGLIRPVETVSWDDCQEFLAKLNATQKASGQFRLPTEAEWEWACRAGTRTSFCFGNADTDLGQYAWYRANSGDMTYPVGRSKPNAWGLHDCHGNVLEWCSDWWGNYSADPWPGKFRWTRDPKGPAKGVSRVLRGGSWRDSPWHCRSACRSYASTTNRHERYGFRVALSIAEP